MMKQMLKRTLKRTLAVLLTALLVAGAAPAAGIADWVFMRASAETYSGSCGNNVTWSLDTETGVLTISGTGAMKGYSSSQVPWYSYRLSVKAVTIGSGVTSIGDSAFAYCTSLASVTIPDGVTSIGYGAFAYCTSLASVTIPDGVTSIGNWAFYAVGNIVYTGAAEGSPWGARSLNGYVNGFLVYDSAQRKVLRACSSAVQGNVTIPSSVTSIGNEAFYDCINLASVTIPSSVTSIGNEAFYGCISLASVTIPDSVTTIGEYAFSGCTNLASVTIGSGLTSINPYVFTDCTSLAEFTVNADNTAFCSDADGVLYNKDKTELIRYPAGNSRAVFAIPSSVTSIGNEAFYGCINLASVTIPDSVTSIGGAAFRDCRNLTSVTIPDGVTSIGGAAFCDCWNLTSVTIPDGVTSIDYYAFQGCTSLASVTIPDSVTTIGSSAFSGVESIVYSGSATGSPWGATHHYRQVIIQPTCTEAGFTTYACSVCGYSYTTDETPALGHDYDSVVIQPTCTEGGFTTYTCSVCGDSYTMNETPALGHVFGEWTVATKPTLTSEGVEKRVCARCGSAQVRPIDKLPSGTPVVSAADAVVGCSAGRLVRVPVTLRNNPGVIATRLYIGYDTQQLRLVGVDNGDVFGDAVFLSGGDLSAEPYTVLWSDDDARTDNTADGTLVTLTFEVQPTATVGETVVTVTYDADSTFNAALQFAQLYTSDGTVLVVDCTPGDASRDGKISLLDSVMLTRYLADGWDVTINEVNADVNGDAVLDLKDVVLIRRYLAGGWDAVLI